MKKKNQSVSPTQNIWVGKSLKIAGFVFLAMLVLFQPCHSSGKTKPASKEEVSGGEKLKPMLNQVVAGTIKDEGGNLLPFATIEARPSGIKTVANANARFSFEVPNNTESLEISYSGFESKLVILSSLGNLKEIVVMLKRNNTSLDEVKIASISRGQAKAITEQKNSLNIKNVIDREQIEKFPDQNAAEALQRIPGITINRDQGEGEYVSIRGIPPELISITLNGQRIPSPDPGDERGVGMGLLQIGLMQSIVVSKSVTPDMDGDAIGGTINLKLRQAPEKKVFSLSAAAGYNMQHSEYDQLGSLQQRYALTLGSRSKNKKWGLIIQSNYSDNRFGSVLNEYTYINDDSDSLRRKRWNDYDISRKRFGITVSPDFRYKNGFMKLTVTNNFFKDYEIRRRANYTTNNNREERQIRNRNEDMYLQLYQLYTENNFGKWKMDGSLNYIGTKLNEPDISSYSFRRKNDMTKFTKSEIFSLDGTNTFPNVTAPILLNDVRSTDELTKDADITGMVNFERQIIQTGQSQIGFKTGVKYIRKERSYRTSILSSSLAPGKRDSTLPGQFAHTNVRTKTMLNNPNYNPWEIDNAGDGSTYDATEKVMAGYVQFYAVLNEKLHILTGVRMENTNVDYYHILTDTDGSSSYMNWLPGLHLTYKPNKKINLRASYARTLSRPPYTGLVPYYFKDDIDHKISQGNPDLKAAGADNFDIMFEYYPSQLNYYTAGVFHKRISNLVVVKTYFEMIGGTQYEISQPLNASSSKVGGFEVAANQRFSNDTTSFFRNLGIYANYTYTVTETEAGGRKLPLGSSPRHSGNLSLFYENQKLDLTFSLTGVFRDYILRTIGTNEKNDIYFAKQTHIDFSASKRIYKGLGAYLQWINITDQDEKEIFAIPGSKYSRLHQYSQFGTSILIGLKYNL